MKYLPPNEKPREKLINKGVEYLSTLELLIVLIGSGNKKRDVIAISRDILQYCIRENKELVDLTVVDLIGINGIGKAKASTIIASIALGSRRIIKDKIYLKKPKDIFQYLQPQLKNKKVEEFHVIMLDIKLKVIKSELIAKGDKNTVIIDPKDVFSKALELRAHSIAIAHNHPSGDPTPSEADRVFTKNFLKFSKIIGIKIVDHVIIGEESYYSFSAEGYFK